MRKINVPAELDGACLSIKNFNLNQRKSIPKEMSRSYIKDKLKLPKSKKHRSKNRNNKSQFLSKLREKRHKNGLNTDLMFAKRK